MAGTYDSAIGAMAIQTSSNACDHVETNNEGGLGLYAMNLLIKA